MPTALLELKKNVLKIFSSQLLVLPCVIIVPDNYRLYRLLLPIGLFIASK